MGWAKKIEDRYQVSLPVDLSVWFDDEIWQECSVANFGQSVPPDELLDDQSCVIWGGLMLPDSLPVLENGCGDVIAARVGIGDTITEYVEWNHEGMHWHPVGASLAETLIYDAYRSHESEPDSNDECFILSDWAERLDLPRVDAQLGNAYRAIRSGNEVVEISSPDHPGLSRDLVDQAMRTPLHEECWQRGGQNVAELAKVSWDELRSWLANPTLADHEAREKLSGSLGIPVRDLFTQQLATAERVADHIVTQRQDLSWAYAVLGQIAERRGDLAGAQEWYEQGLTAPGATASFTLAWAGFTMDAFKYSVARLVRFGSDLERTSSEYLAAALKNYQAGEIDPLKAHWLSKAESHRSHVEFEAAWNSYISAASDRGSADHMELILKQMYSCAIESGSPGLAAVVSRHIASLPA